MNMMHDLEFWSVCLNGVMLDWLEFVSWSTRWVMMCYLQFRSGSIHWIMTDYLQLCSYILAWLMLKSLENLVHVALLALACTLLLWAHSAELSFALGPRPLTCSMSIYLNIVGVWAPLTLLVLGWIRLTSFWIAFAYLNLSDVELARLVFV